MLQHRMETLLAAGDLFMYRWTRAMRPYFLKGLDLGASDEAVRRHLFAGEATWAEFKEAYRFESPLDDFKGYNPLRYAVMSNNVQVARELLTLGADAHSVTRVNERSELGNLGSDTLLATAAQSCGGHMDCGEMIELLLEHGADPLRLSPHSGNTVLNEAAMWGNSETLAYLTRRVPRLLDDDVYRADRHPPFYHTPVLACAIFGQLDPLVELRSIGASCAGIEFIGHTALHAAAHWGYTDVLAELLDDESALASLDLVCTPPVWGAGGPNVFGNFLYYLHRGLRAAGGKDKMITFMVDAIGATPLHGAVAGNYILCVRLLVLAGADTRIKNIHGETPLDLARRHHFDDIVRFLEAVEQAGPNTSTLHINASADGVPVPGGALNLARMRNARQRRQKAIESNSQLSALRLSAKRLSVENLRAT
mmetsp:Transcript_3590/g.10532  ORF Transcript_3590/g.10532 Transcript_3590/m.10532 type:complete len:423 (-) Transcript_3590:586-1854(-)